MNDETRAVMTWHERAVELEKKLLAAEAERDTERARGKLLQAVVDAVEENGGYNDMHDDVWEAMDALTRHDFEQRKNGADDAE